MPLLPLVRRTDPTSKSRHSAISKGLWPALQRRLPRLRTLAERLQPRRPRRAGRRQLRRRLPPRAPRTPLDACHLLHISCIAVAVQFSAQNRPQILVAELINGVVLGAYPVIAPTYISEVTPVKLRGIGAAFVNLSFVIGQLVASGVLAGTEGRQDRWSYDILFACQWIFPIVILIALPFCPESPWWLVRRGQTAKAERALQRLTAPSVDRKAILANIELTTQLEIDESNSDVGFSECFRGTDLRRTLISTMVYAIQPLVGNFLVIGYAVYFFELAGLPTASAFNLGVGLLALGFVGTLLSWPLMALTGRRTIYNWGLVICTLIVLLIALLDVAPSYSANTSFAWAQSSLMVIYNFFYDLTIGPLCFVILCETSSAKLRGKTIAFSTAVNALINIACAVGIPYALNPDQGNKRGKLVCHCAHSMHRVRMLTPCPSLRRLSSSGPRCLV